jgi:transposase
VRFVSEWRQNGATSAKSQGGDQRSHRIEAHREMILSVIKAKPDMTLVQIAEMLEAETGASFAPSSVWRFLDRHAITFKKKPRTQPSRTGPTSPPPAAWRELAPRLDPDKLVFIDETGCPYRKSNPGILMMETAEDRAADNIPGPLGAARDRRILVQ